VARRRPGSAASSKPLPWKVYGAEAIGTALLVWIGLSVVVLDFGTGSPVIGLLPDAGLRRLITGFLFGTTGAIIAISPFGKESGAHINPVVTLGFWMMGRFDAKHVPGYLVSQFAGAALGASGLLAWGTMGRSVEFGSTVPGFGNASALAGETVTTFALMFLLFYFLRHRTLKHFTPALFPPLYALMVWLEAPLSGTSTNPARTLGPALVAWEWRGWWIYWMGPLIGTLLAVAVHRLAGHRWPRIEVAKMHHFTHDPHRVFHTGPP
jgi:aquaporin Z